MLRQSRQMSIRHLRMLHQPMLKSSRRRDKSNLIALELMPFVLGIRLE